MGSRTSSRDHFPQNYCINNFFVSILDLKLHPRKHIVYKGINPDVDSYSAFFDNAKLGKTCLADLIKDAGCTDVYVCGIATDVCVGEDRYY